MMFTAWRHPQTHWILTSTFLVAFKQQTLIFTYTNASGLHAKDAKVHHPLSGLRILAKERRKMLPYPPRFKRSNEIAPQSSYFKTAFRLQPRLSPQVLLGSSRLQDDQITVIWTSESSCFSKALSYVVAAMRSTVTFFCQLFADHAVSQKKPEQP